MDPFEQSADMRLLELQRKALGVEAPARPNWTGSNAELNEGIPLHEEELPVLTGARLTVDLSASPGEKLIPGAVVTLSLAVHNAGDKDAADVRVVVPVPGASSYREGSLTIDQRRVSVSEADAFFGEGFLLPKLAGGQRIGFVWQISVEPGLKPLIVSPRVTAKDAGVSGGKPALLGRGSLSPTALPAPPPAPAQEPERPFYELDADEERDFARETITGEDVTTAHEAPLVVMPDILPEPVPEPEPQPEPQAQPEPEPVAAEPAPTQAAVEPRIYCGFDAASLAVVKKLFAADSFGQIPHYILQNSLACSLAPDGRDFGIRQHLSQQGGLLSRALLMHKLRKATNVGDFSSGKTGFDLSGGTQNGAQRETTLLFTPLTQAEIDFCAPVEQRNPLESFIRIRQLAVALQARKAETRDADLRARLEDLLDRYAAGARAAINRTFIKAKLDKNYDPFGAADPAADKLAHELVAALEELFAA